MEPTRIKSNESPVFIVGMNGSGTTMLADCLSNHPELYIFPRETRVLPYFLSMAASFGDLSQLPARRKLADEIGRIDHFKIVNRHTPVVLSDRELIDPGISGVINSIFMHFASAAGKLRWGEKTPMHIQHMTLLKKYFPQAKFLHIFRDGRDVAQSFNRRWKKNPYRTIYRWKEVVKRGRSQGKKLGVDRYMEVSYEKFTEDPERQLREICDFLNLSFHNSLCRTSGFMHSKRQMDPAIRADSIIPNSGKWKNYFSDEQIAAMEKIAGDYLSILGYHVISIPGDENPEAWKLKLWHRAEYIAGSVQYFKRYGLKYAPMFWAKVFSTIKQNRTNYH